MIPSVGWGLISTRSGSRGACWVEILESQRAEETSALDAGSVRFSRVGEQCVRGAVGCISTGQVDLVVIRTLRAELSCSLRYPLLTQDSVRKVEVLSLHAVQTRVQLASVYLAMGH